MVRIAYFGTDGCPGHYAIPIRGKFTEEDIKVIESVDCDDFYKVFDVMRFKIAEFKGWTILGIPASLDDHRPGSKTVIFIEGKANETDFMEVIQEYSFLKNKKPVDVGEVSDGYHTFNELYRYSMLYNAAFFNLLARSGQVEVCKSRRHSDGEKCFGSDDWFIVMAILPTGQVSNHYESKYWDLFDVPERETAFEYDGHTPNEAADRLKKYLKLPRRGMTFEQALERLKLGRKIKRIDWGKKYICMFDVNILMVDTGQKVASNWNPTEHDIMSNDWEIAG